MNHTPSCPVDVDMRGQWMSTAKPLCNCGGNLNSLTIAESGCEHEFKFSHQSVEARGVQAIYQTVIYVICPKCGLVKTQI